MPRQIRTVKALEEYTRTRLSPRFFMRDFLYSDISNLQGIPNIPHDPDLAVEAARGLCVTLLEPLETAFGRIAIRSAYRSAAVNQWGHENTNNCASNAYNYGHHIFDIRDKNGHLGATVSIVVTAFVDLYEELGDWRPLAWFIHDHLPYGSMYFFPKLAAFNLNWSEAPARWIKSYAQPQRGFLTNPGMDNFEGDHSEHYNFPLFHEAKNRLRGAGYLPG